MKFGSRLEKFASVLVLFSTGILVSGTKACQEDYDFARQSNVPAATGTSVLTPTASVTATPTGTVVVTGSTTPVATGSVTAVATKTVVATTTASETTQDVNADGSLFNELSAISDGKVAASNKAPDGATSGAGGASGAGKGQNWLGAAFAKDPEGSWKDRDGDGYSDALEEEASTDPQDSAATPKLSPATRLDDRIHAQDVELEADRLGDESRTADGDPAEADTDADGIPDDAEAQRGTNPNASDSDHDGLRDDREIVLGTNPLKVDSDGDGVSDSREYSNGSDPTIPEPKPQAG